MSILCSRHSLKGSQCKSVHPALENLYLVQCYSAFDTHPDHWPGYTHIAERSCTPRGELKHSCNVTSGSIMQFDTVLCACLSASVWMWCLLLWKACAPDGAAQHLSDENIFQACLGPVLHGKYFVPFWYKASQRWVWDRRKGYVAYASRKIEQHGHTHKRNSSILCVNFPAMKPSQPLGVKTPFCYIPQTHFLVWQVLLLTHYYTKYCWTSLHIFHHIT